jgi:hypothetical protein
MNDQQDAIREVLAVVDDRAARGWAVSEFRKIVPSYHAARHIHIGGRDSPLGVCYRKEEIPKSGGQWMVYARFDTLDVLEWCLRLLNGSRVKQLSLFE